MIKVGERYKCIKDVVNANDPSRVYFYKDKIYSSFKRNTLENEFSVNHNLYGDFVDEHFKVVVMATENEDRVNHPSHYTWLKEKCGVEVIDITRHLDFDIGNAIKYLLRAGHKSEEGYDDRQKHLEDLKKAAWYINDKIKMLEKEYGETSSN